MAFESAIRKAKCKRLMVIAIIDMIMEEEEDEVNIKKKRNRINWMRSWIARWEERGAFHQLVKELVVEDSAGYRDFFRLNSQQFEFILKKIAKLITKNETLMRPSIKPAERLAVTLRYLATGETFKSLEYSFRISRTLISSIVTECCEAIYRTLRSEYLKAPTTQEEWLAIAKTFEERWNFPNGIGAIDGKRIILQQPYNAGSHYFDYKSNNSVILLAIIGPNYECLWADMGTNGRAPDGGIWQRSNMKKSIETNELCLPPPKPLPGRQRSVPYVLTGDDAFPLTTYLMKPYPRTGLTTEQRVFNYRLSRMRRISENGFGILANMWRVFRAPILLQPDKVIKTTLATLVLHNFLR